MGGMQHPFWDDQPAAKPLSRGGDGSSRQSLRDHRDQEQWLSSESRHGHRESNSRSGYGGPSHKNMYGPGKSIYGDDHSESSLPHIHGPHGMSGGHPSRDDPYGEQPSDSFLADYLTTLEKQVRSGKLDRHVADTARGEEDERRSGRGGMQQASSSKQPMPFFRKPSHGSHGASHGSSYELSGGSSTHFGLNRGARGRN
jgi:hypothetical protein